MGAWAGAGPGTDAGGATGAALGEGLIFEAASTRAAAAESEAMTAGRRRNGFLIMAGLI